MFNFYLWNWLTTFCFDVGVIGSLFSILQFLTAPLAGSLSDRYGRKPALLFSMVICLFPFLSLSFYSLFLQVGIAASYALWALADSFALFVLARAIGGVSKANVSLATAVMADVTDVSTRTKAMVRSITAKFKRFAPNNIEFLSRRWSE